MCNTQLINVFIVCVEVAETDEDLLGTGLQRPRMKPVLEIEEPQPSGQNVPGLLPQENRGGYRGVNGGP